MFRRDAQERALYEAFLKRIATEIDRRYGSQVAFAQAFEPGKGFAAAKSRTNKLINGQTEWKLSDLARACRLLDVSADYLLGLVARQESADVVAMPFIELRHIDSDAAILDHGTIARPARVIVDAGLQAFYGAAAPVEWEMSRMVLVEIPADGAYPAGAYAIVDRRPTIDSYHGIMAVAKYGDDYLVGRISESPGGEMLITVRGAPPREEWLPCREAVLGAVVLVAEPTGALG